MGHRVSRPAWFVIGAIMLAAAGLAIWWLTDLYGDKPGAEWAPVGAFFVLVYGAVAASVVVIGDAIVQFLIRKRREGHAA